MTEEKKYPTIKPQISLGLYCKWLTDKYQSLEQENEKLKRQCAHKDKEIASLKKQIDFIIANNKVVHNKYLDERKEFKKELYKEDLIISYKQQVEALNRRVKYYRTMSKQLIDKIIELERKKSEQQ